VQSSPGVDTNEGAILYTEAGPSIYTSLTTGQLANIVSAERIEQD